MSAPWFVGGGAEHSPETARLVAHAATSGARGVVDVGDYKVQQLATAGTSVRVGPGAGVIPNDYPSVESQSYLTRRSAEVNVPVPATGAGAGRTDLLVQRIIDPQYAGSGNPADPAFVFDPFVLIQGVAAGTSRVEPLNLGYPALPLARLEIPASTGTITSAMIKDVRRLANPRRERHLFRHQPATSQTVNANVFALWPDWEPTFEVPVWATHVVAVMTGAGIQKPPGGLCLGELTLEFTNPGQGNPDFAIGTTAFEEDANTTFRRTGVLVAGEANCAASRGLTKSVRIGARRFTANGDGVLIALPTSNFVIDVEFQERAV